MKLPPSLSHCGLRAGTNDMAETQKNEARFPGPRSCCWRDPADVMLASDVEGRVNPTSMSVAESCS
jgi:hypothetical protein